MKAEYLAVVNADKVKADFVNDLEKILSPLSVAGRALVSKVEHMINHKGAGLKDAVIMLKSFQRGTKRRLRATAGSNHTDLYEYTVKDGNEKYSHKGNLERAHFRWNDDQRYKLTNEEIQNISKLVGVLEGAKIVNEYTKQALDFLNATSTSLTIEFKKYGSMPWDVLQQRDIYRCKIKNKLGSYSFDFGQSINASQRNEQPTEYDILSCLTKYDPETFEDFCSEFGYDEDSRSAKRTYNAVKKEWQAIEKLFSPEQIEQLQEIQ